MIHLTMNTEYVKHWGLWEAIREILQNALDEGDMEWGWDGEELRITSPTSKLDRRSLLLGSSTKKEGSIGQFGEGYKLALLVLCRMGHSVVIQNGQETWIPSLQWNEEFESELLSIDIQPNLDAAESGVDFLIGGIGKSEYEAIMGRWRRDRVVSGEVLDDEPGNIYVGGLWVCHLDAFKKYGYDFAPHQIKLNRDRDIPQMFDLQWAAGQLVAARAADEAVLADMEESAAEVEYVTHHISSHRLAAAFTAKYPDHVPVSSHYEVQRAVEAGLQYRFVPQRLRDALWTFKTWIENKITRKSPVERLRDFRDTIKDRLETDELQELNNIIDDLSV